MTPARPKPVVLCILDGWGINEESAYNAIAMANTPNWTRFLNDYPNSEILTSGLDVGLPEGQMGNSEVGHMNIGSGRIVMQDLPRIDQAIADGSIWESAALQEFTGKLKNSGGTAHLMGLASAGGVHAHIGHMAAVALYIAGQDIPVVIHAMLDGRDTPPASARKYLSDFLAEIKQEPGISLGTIAGRYYAMDRDKRWERVELAYRAMAEGKGLRSADSLAVIEERYHTGQTDEFIVPTVIGDYAGMKDGDGLFMLNFRADRARQLLTALLDPEFQGFSRPHRIQFAATLGVVEYSERLSLFHDIVFPPVKLEHLLGELIAEQGMRQLKIAETEKYAHVTFFFNGGREEPYPGEDRILVPSPKVATYDLQPEMSAPEVTEKLVAAIESGIYDFIVVNYANADMVGHTGDLTAAIRAVEAIDQCLGEVTEATLKENGIMMITADHGNIEMMLDTKSDVPLTAHTLNPVPFVLIGGSPWINNISLECGRLCDIAPTILALMRLKQPAEMTGHSLLLE